MPPPSKACLWIAIGHFYGKKWGCSSDCLRYHRKHRASRVLLHLSSDRGGGISVGSLSREGVCECLAQSYALYRRVPLTPTTQLAPCGLALAWQGAPPSMRRASAMGALRRFVLGRVRSRLSFIEASIGAFKVTSTILKGRTFR